MKINFTGQPMLDGRIVALIKRRVVLISFSILVLLSNSNSKSKFFTLGSIFLARVLSAPR